VSEKSTYYDIAIIGAGPAGCTTALKAAPSGLRIALVDRAKLPHAKICGDAISGTSLYVMKRLPGSIYEEFLEMPGKLPSWGIRFVSPDLEELEIPFLTEKNSESPAPGFIFNRNDFDRFLLEKIAAYPNVEIVDSFAVKEFRRNEDDIVMVSEERTIRAAVVVGADGVHSIVGKVLAGNKPDLDHYCMGIRAYFRGVTGMHGENFIDLAFLKELLPGYFWIFPMADGRVNAGFGLMYKQVKDDPLSMTARFRELIDKDPYLAPRFKNAVMEGKPEAHGLPLGPVKKVISGDRFLLAGDAASLVDPFSGEGIGNAMISGEIAGEILADAFARNNFSKEFFAAYDKRLHDKTAKELKISHAIQQMAGNATLFNYVVRKANRNEDLRRMFTKMFTSQDIRSELTKPSFYVNLLLK
jgi:menaquinone-9 beta-reductase